MNFEIRPLIESEFPYWDNFVDNSIKGTLFHKIFWLKTCGRRFVIYGYFKGGKLFAGIPLTYRTKLKFKAASHPALTPYSGVLFRRQDTKYVNRISKEKGISREIAKRLKNEFHFVHIQFPPGPADLQPFIWEGFSTDVRYTYIINLDNGLDDIWKSMEDKKRNDIRKAERDGISVVLSDDFEQTFRLVEKTFTRQDMFASFKSTAFSYNETLKEITQSKSFFAKNKNDDLIAVVYIVWDNKRSYYLLGGYDPDKSHHGGSALAMWEAIKFTKENLGLKQFDFEGSMVPQVEQFFRKFGGEQTPYYTIGWIKPFLKVPIGIYQVFRKFPSQVKRMILTG